MRYLQGGCFVTIMLFLINGICAVGFFIFLSFAFSTYNACAGNVNQMFTPVALSKFLPPKSSKTYTYSIPSKPSKSSSKPPRILAKPNPESGSMGSHNSKNVLANGGKGNQKRKPKELHQSKSKSGNTAKHNGKTSKTEYGVTSKSVPCTPQSCIPFPASSPNSFRENEAVYNGKLKRGIPHGRGRLIYKDKVYEGYFKNGVYDGKGVLTTANGNKYSGQWKNGKMNGTGTMQYQDGSKYIGKWENGQKHGHGITTYYDDTTCCGKYRNGKMNGYGVCIFGNGTWYRGEYKNGLEYGYGFKQYPNKISIDGKWRNGKLVHGLVKCQDGKYIFSKEDPYLD